MNSTKIIPVILSGGSGTRLWPLSREQYPKQYLKLTGNETLFQQTILRLSGIENIADPIIVCNANHRFLVAEQCQNLKLINPIIMLEPVGKNTAPAILAAAFHSFNLSKKSLLLVLSADHLIQDDKAFHDAVRLAIKHAVNSKLVTFGIVPTEPNTGYGYIKSGFKEDENSFKVDEFLEKPSPDVAKRYIESGEYLWNSGIFMFESSSLITEMELYSPEIFKSVDLAVKSAKQDLDFIRLDSIAFTKSPSDSIDYALMEKSENVVVVPMNSGWSDIGSWKSLYDKGLKDKYGNILNGDVISKKTTNSFIYAKNHLLVTIGVDNLIVVDTPDATFIASIDKAHEVKGIVDQLESDSRTEVSSHRKVYRPWGWYDSIETGLNFQVKRLNISPGAKLSLQLHNHRAEHWVVVCGKAKVTNDDRVLFLEKGESTFIPVGIKHAIENDTKESLEIIEVQSGTYLGEDDIVRFEDIYGRVND